MPPTAVTARAIEDAYHRVPAAFRGMPQFVSEPLSEQLGTAVVVKAETANPIGCFKGRGTWLAVDELVKRGTVGEGRGLIVASAGNFGQGVAYAARTHRIPLRVYAARSANAGKLAAMRRLGADVRLAGNDFDAAREAAARDAAQGGGTLLVDGKDPWIAIGAGTIALELTRGVEAGELPPVSTLFVPVGNGALIGGIGAWMRAAAPAVRVIGVQAEVAPAMTLSWREHRPIETETAATVADGIAARVPVPEALELMLAVVDEMLLVSETQILGAQDELRRCLPFTVEPAAAVGWAALRTAGSAEPAAFILTGGNVAEPG